MNHMYIYIVVGIVIIICIVRSQTTRYLFKSVNQKDFPRNPKGTNLTLQQQQALQVGLIHGELIMSYCDTLETGVNPKGLNEVLRDWWGIIDRKSAIEVLNSMMEEGDRVRFDVVLEFIEQYPNEAMRTQMIKQEYPGDKRIAKSAKKLAACIKAYKYDPDFPYSDKNLKKGILGWDAGRVVNLSRMCYDMGYITSEEAWDLINSAYKATTAHFSDWHSFATSYLIGCGMWRGDDQLYRGFKNVAAKNALTNPESPWRQNPLTP